MLAVVHCESGRLPDRGYKSASGRLKSSGRAWSREWDGAQPRFQIGPRGIVALGRSLPLEAALKATESAIM